MSTQIKTCRDISQGHLKAVGVCLAVALVAAIAGCNSDGSNNRHGNSRDAGNPTQTHDTAADSQEAQNF